MITAEACRTTRLVTVGWMPGDCPGAKTAKLGHLWVRCHAEPGCPSIWYPPRHQPDLAA